MRKKAICCILGMAFLPCGLAWAAEISPGNSDAVQTPAPQLKSALGAVAGGISGIGISYRHYYSDTFGIQLAGIGFGGLDNAFASFGVDFFSIISRSENRRLYVPIGISALYMAGGYCTSYNYYSSSCERQWSGNGTVMIGSGLGIELGGASQFTFTFELPLTLMFGMIGGVHFSGIYPIPVAGIHFYF